MTEHTPTPWRDPGEHPLTGYGDINHVIAGSDGTIIGSLYANCFGAPHMLELPTVEQAGANAALIVRAVNNHEALVKALIQARLRIEYLGAACNDHRHFEANASIFLPRIDEVLAAVPSPNITNPRS